MVAGDPDRLNRRNFTTLPPALSMRSILANRSILKSALFVGGVFVALIVEWFNTDDRVFVIEASDGAFTSRPLNMGDSFQFDYSSLPTASHRYKAILETDSLFGGVRIPGLVNTRPEQ